MLAAAIHRLLSRLSPLPVETAQSDGLSTAAIPVATVQQAQSEPCGLWPGVRVELNHQLWGNGYLFPGGEAETLRLTRPLGLSPASSLLIVGVGTGGPAATVARNLGAWVTGTEQDPALLATARGFVTKAQLGKKITIKPWDPATPAFAARGHHHCLALEALRGAQPEPILDSLAQALKPGGQLVLTGLAADNRLNASDPILRRWAELEARDPGDLLPGIAVTRMLGRIGLDVRIAEDISTRHIEHAMLGWRLILKNMRNQKPPRQAAAQLVSEAELWLLRRKLMRDGHLRMMRWHAISRAPLL